MSIVKKIIENPSNSRALRLLVSFLMDDEGGSGDVAYLARDAIYIY